MSEIFFKPKVNGIIADVPQIKFGEVIAAFQEVSPLATVGFSIVDVAQLTPPLEDQFKKSLTRKDLNTVLTIFPGLGAQALWTFLSPEFQDLLSKTNLIYLNTNRSSTNDGYQVTVENPSLWKLYKNQEINDVVIFDDVYFTGATCRAILRQITQDQPRLETINWSLYTWLLAYNPDTAWNESWLDKNYASRYRRIGTSTAALNSLSTLLGNTEKSDQVKTRYAQRFFPSREESFLNMLSVLKKQI